jgi:hypothetical protein
VSQIRRLFFRFPSFHRRAHYFPLQPRGPFTSLDTGYPTAMISSTLVVPTNHWSSHPLLSAANNSIYYYTILTNITIMIYKYIHYYMLIMIIIIIITYNDITDQWRCSLCFRGMMVNYEQVHSWALVWSSL